MASSDEAATKKLAQQGQWKTPPLPVFASTAAATAAAAPTDKSDPSITLPTTLPTTPDEYARMLQEAYQRGAEAAARAQKTEGEEYGTQAVPSTAVPHPAPQYAQQKSVSAMQANAANNYNFPLSRPQPVPSMKTVHQSVSMPDISSYHKEAATDEEEKRKKRLARNRASARLRRLKKKNLVDSYEGEVGILEAALTKLRSHQWSTDDNNHDALIDALSMERGQQPLTPVSRRELIQSIVTQQKEQVDNLLECQLENWILSSLASKETDEKNEELDELTDELQSILELTPQQLADIKQASTGCIREIQDLNTVSSCLDAIISNEWLLDSGVDEMASQFTGILNPAQLSKFLLWTDHNSDAIEKLDYVNVGVGVENGPVFEFGVDEGMEGGD